MLRALVDNRLNAQTGAIRLRRIRLELDRPTRDKETELYLLTDVPRERAGALLLAAVYQDRWRLAD